MLGPKAISKSFSARLTVSGDKLKWVVIRIPFDSVKIWGVRGHLRVKGEINGYAFRSSVFPTGDGRHMMLVNKAMQKGGKVRPGMEARFRLQPDLEKREIQTPPELDRILKTSRRLQKFYLSISGSLRKFIVDSIAKAKQTGTRARRAEQAAEFMMETMEAEIELPPLLRQAFARNPEVIAVWQKMTPLRRRAHLLGIFYHRSHDARLRRIERSIAEMKKKLDTDYTDGNASV
jgi:uncharacterized protein YdeI (YjbR/CyaY-like superfamily)